jgi:hypothetical protein
MSVHRRTIVGRQGQLDASARIRSAGRRPQGYSLPNVLSVADNFLLWMEMGGDPLTIFIGKSKMTDEGAAEIISKQHDLVSQIVRAWCQSNIDHHFKNDRTFRKAVQKNQELLHSRGAIEALFTSRNYVFSTNAEDRKETLYFEDRATKRTGRLRQQHPKGPLARIDRKSRTRRFLSRERFECVKEWHDKHQHRLPSFGLSDEAPKNGKHLIEFTCEKKKKLSAWHSSNGTIKMSRHDLDQRICSALENILGIRHGKKPLE